MIYIFYANGKSAAGKALHRMLQRAFKKEWMRRCGTLAELSQKLHEPLYDVCAAVLLIDDRNALAEILPLRDILQDIQLIIIFSGRDDISLADVMTLRPRFVTWMDADLSEVAGVLRNMMKREAEWRRVVGMYCDPSIE
jgi:hypothetical protein